jgi:hypothetical protein
MSEARLPLVSIRLPKAGCVAPENQSGADSAFKDQRASTLGKGGCRASMEDFIRTLFLSV